MPGRSLLVPSLILQVLLFVGWRWNCNSREEVKAQNEDKNPEPFILFFTGSSVDSELHRSSVKAAFPVCLRQTAGGRVLGMGVGKGSGRGMEFRSERDHLVVSVVGSISLTGSE